MRDRFINPRTGAIYDFTINHNEEDQFGRARNIEASAPTGDGPLTLQQGDDEPMVIVLKGKILDAAQHAQFISWMALGRTQTIYYRDAFGEEFEVLPTSYMPKRNRVAANPRDPSIPWHIYEYEMRLHVIAFRAGPWVGTQP